MQLRAEMHPPPCARCGIGHSHGVACTPYALHPSKRTTCPAIIAELWTTATSEYSVLAAATRAVRVRRRRLLPVHAAAWTGAREGRCGRTGPRTLSKLEESVCLAACVLSDLMVPSVRTCLDK